MPGITYNLNIPLATNNPSVDQPNMKINTNAIDTLLQVDHISFNTTNGGQHQQVTLPNTQVSDPSPTGVGSEIYTKTLAGIAQLFFANSASVTQLTGGPQTLSTTGYTTLPGGLLLQWGQGTATSGGAPVDFSKTFATCYAIVCTRATNSSTLISIAAAVPGGSPSSFTAVSSNSSSPISFVALGI